MLCNLWNNFESSKLGSIEVTENLEILYGLQDYQKFGVFSLTAFLLF
jgi:hypothetical protein